jgi:hypothetical protein
MVPTPNSYSRLICSNNSTFPLLSIRLLSPPLGIEGEISPDSATGVGPNLEYRNQLALPSPVAKFGFAIQLTQNSVFPQSNVGSLSSSSSDKDLFPIFNQRELTTSDLAVTYCGLEPYTNPTNN